RVNQLSTKLKVIQSYLTDEFEYDTISNENDDILTLKVLESKEEERRRMSRELHDGPAQLLANVILNLEIMDHHLKENGAVSLLEENEKIKEQIQNALHEIRQIIYDLRPIPLYEKNLSKDIKKYIDYVKGIHPNVQIIYDFNEVDRLNIPANIGIHLFRIIQESIHNALKHAKASQIHLKFTNQEEALIITISDNGIGIQNNDFMFNNEQFGIRGMKERIELLKGELHIDSNERSGTTVLMKLNLS